MCRAALLGNRFSGELFNLNDLMIAKVLFKSYFSSSSVVIV